jgi:eukaryotic-like serine/threonine-protein kinase
MVERIAQYRITRKLGEGGMGVVYAAHDERLDRPVAIKMLRAGTTDDSARERLWREARSAAAVTHPNMCQLYEVGETQGELYIAMELLEGESLAERIARGPLPLGEATPIALAMLDALESLHRRGIVHRDLKPSNVFLAVHGVKLLDFGVARAMAPAMTENTELTLPGVIVGTPHYVAPERLIEQPADVRGDLFAVGAVLYEMLSGRKAFPGRNVIEIFHAIVHQEPPPLGGSPAAMRVDRVLRRALAKNPQRRQASAEAMAGELRDALEHAGVPDAAERAEALRRMIVLPFRVLKPDPETDFLAFSLPDAITSSLSSLDSIVMRSSMNASRFHSDQQDVREIASQAEVDIVLVGTLMRAGDQLRVTAQLVEGANGSLIWSQTSQVRLGDLFQLQDSLTRRIVDSVAVPLSAHDETALRRDVPADQRAYELYLRANELSVHSSEWMGARDLYVECLERDPDFAPAWARLGRVYRVIAQYGGEQADANYEKAQDAFRRALELNPDLPTAHYLYTGLEIDLGRVEQAMVRLLRRASAHPTDAELYAGLVQSCRYCGLLDASIAAHEQAARLDPGVRTSVNHAYLMRGDYQRSIETNVEDAKHIDAIAYQLWGRPDEAVALLLEMEKRKLPRFHRTFVESLRLLIQDRTAEAREALDWMSQNFTVRDPCGIFYFARLLARAGESDRAIAMIERSVGGGFTCRQFMMRDPWLESIRSDERFVALVRRAETREQEARAAFVQAGGGMLLHVTS